MSLLQQMCVSSSLHHSFLAVICDNKLFVCGGGTETGAALSDMYCFDISTHFHSLLSHFNSLHSAMRKWDQLSDLPHAMAFPSLYHYNNKVSILQIFLCLSDQYQLYLYGGCTDQKSLRDLYVLDEE